MIETWNKGHEFISFGVIDGRITNQSGTVYGFTREELVFNGWKRVDENQKPLDNDKEEWEDVDMSEPELVSENEIEEIKPRRKSRISKEKA